MVKRRERSIKAHLALSYILFILFFIVFIMITSNLLIERQFISYSKEKQVTQVNQVLSRITDQYDGESFNQAVIEMIGMDAFDDGFIIGVYTEQETMVWDANYHMGHMCQVMINQLYSRMREYDSNYKGEIVTKTYQITVLEEEVGTVTIRHLSPYFYDERDLSFLTTLNQIYFISSLLFMLGAILVAHMISKRIARPIEIVTRELRSIEKGNYEKKELIHSNTKEMNQLARSMERLKDTLNNQERYRNQLTGDIAHELRTPLSTLQATLEALMDGVMEVDHLTMTSLHEEIIRLSKIVGDLNQLHQYDSKQVSISIDNTSIEEVISGIAQKFKAKFKQKNINLVLLIEDVVLELDKDKINQVFTNLLSNALNYTGECGEVKIIVTNQLDHVQITIEDNGCGIKESDLPHVFERLYRSDKSRTRATGGHGIGLSIVKSIIDAHKGTIVIESTFGVGTKVIVTLPKVGSKSY